MDKNTFSILITTKNRINDLKFTLVKIQYLLYRNDVDCIICDDGSTDGTAAFLKENYPNVQLIQNPKSQGLIYSRNRLLNLVKTDYAISLDDDAHFLSENPLETIEQVFRENPKVALLGFRVFWDLKEPERILCSTVSHQMKSFVGCGHVFRMSAWREIPDYPAWFVFYGEEDFASYQLFKKNWEILYLPKVLIHHRVDIKARKSKADYSLRLRRSLRSGWYLYFLFLPLSYIPKRMGYSIWIQLKTKVFKGDWKALKALLLALIDLILALPKIIKNSNRLTRAEYEEYLKLPETRLYWKWEEEGVL